VSRSFHDAYAYREIAPGDRAEVKRLDSKAVQLQASDIIGIDLDVALAHSMQSFELDESSQEMHMPILVSDRDYIAEVGYVTASRA
jgi:hypothetical protein